MGAPSSTSGGTTVFANAGPVVIETDIKNKKMTVEETASLKNMIEGLTMEQKKGIVPIV